MQTSVRASPAIAAALAMMLAAPSVYGLVLAMFLALPVWLRAMSAALIEIRGDWKRSGDP
jgi:hypothetical protein